MAGRIFNVEDPNNEAAGSAGPVRNTIFPPPRTAPVSARPALVASKISTGKNKLTRVPHYPPGYAVPVLARPLPCAAPGSAGPVENTQCPPGSAIPVIATSKKVMSNSQGRKSKLTLGIRQRSEPAPALVIPPCKYLQIYIILLYSSESHAFLILFVLNCLRVRLRLIEKKIGYPKSSLRNFWCQWQFMIGHQAAIFLFCKLQMTSFSNCPYRSNFSNHLVKTTIYFLIVVGLP